jgi:tetratricopeptide (TPR) repeat protein
MGEIVDRDPANTAAKNYVWAIARRIQKEEKDRSLTPAEINRAMAVAEEELEARRQRTQAVLAQMKESARKSGNVRSPQDVLSGVAGLERFIGDDLVGELADAQARAFVDEIAAHLEEALQRKTFVSLKDQFRAEGYLAYVRRDWDRAAERWGKALKEDPGDAEVRRELESLNALVRRKAEKDRLAELANQARLFFRSGRYEEAAEAWGEVSKIDPSFPDLAAQAAAARIALEKSRLQGRLKAMTGEGLALYKAGDVFGAAQKWLEVLQLDPSFEEARGWLQHAGDRMKKSPVPRQEPAPSAKPAEAADRDPDKALALYKEGMMFYAQGNLSEAVRAWTESLRLDPSLNRAREALRQAQAEIQFK